MTSTNSPKDQIRFWADYRPTMEDGDYTITVTQRVQTQNTPPQAITDQPDFTTTRNFSVLGPRFSLDPQEVRAVFPPEGSLGEHSNVLPHILFNRATLPWERSANPKANSKDETQDPPWLALLVFHEGEDPELQTVKLSDLGFPEDNKIKKWGQPKINGAFYTALKPEFGQHPDDLVQLITVSAELLNAIIPQKDELEWLVHVRQAIHVMPLIQLASPASHASTEQKWPAPLREPLDAGGIPTSEPFAVLFANRLPKPNGHTTVHLVSLENLYTGGDFYYNKVTGNINLISLKSWRFACVSPEHDFKGLLSHLDGQSFHLPMNEKEKPISEPYLKQGLAPFVHFMRQGNRSVSWYHGPLLPGENTSAEINLPVRNADSLVRYYKNIGMFDVTYAAAWELGRMLTLQNKRVSVDLFNWKRSHAQKQRDAENLLEHLPLVDQADDLNLPDSVKIWFAQLSLLHGVPFNYLVPDEKLLPADPESGAGSIRFFQVDPLWIDCLLDGAFAVGRVLGTDVKQDAKLKDDGHAPTPPYDHKMISGFLLRSSVVTGYPDLLVDGYEEKKDVEGQEKDTLLECIRVERLSSNVLLCLFAGKITRVDLHQKPESLHFGFTKAEKPELAPSHKKLRDADGGAQNSTVAIPWRGESSDKRVVDIDKLQERIRNELIKNKKEPSINWNVARFAMEMIEGVEKVHFSIG